MQVVDTSRLAKLFLLQSGHAEFRNWLKEKVLAGEPLLAPALLPHELGRVIEREFNDVPPDRRHEIHRRSLVHVQLRPSDWARVFQVAAGGATFYDAAFVALAQDTGATIVTADDRMASLARGLEVPVLRF